MNYVELIYIICIVFIYYTFGLVLSNIINYIFPSCNFNKKDRYIVIECGIQLILIYLIYFLTTKKINKIINIVFYNITKKNIYNIVLSISTLAFTTGIYKHLDELNKKITYIKEKYITKYISK